ncbi:uncharacterized protein L969DRAFT_44452 [Mixia osmundae IAM 14324]|uniref:RNA polymerase II subunit A C-terminal domain phosphatase n=1 Tax=Mixia osmundae (strain CBS 9802 / IAM 14324 / JCM 22182 / KY 12970) TaxID=764103 RepID=G7E069_MIXOS|nr:uncharacterized protein L969DRAFT_44452 [Mixia osmundae IAM 14324]KEI42219.1 hypothetical protein L969DRAFT_44452 [Mixia osmundae IAM 14324]GAA96229.1 hypothetical protein E5Q_02893 [Mixia osmundae IAM 14324]
MAQEGASALASTSGATAVCLEQEDITFPVSILTRLVPAGSTARTSPTELASFPQRKQDTCQVKRGTPLFTYEYTKRVKQDASNSAAKGKMREVEYVDQRLVATYESRLEGQLIQWKCKEGQRIAGPQIELLSIAEPCTHYVQLHGLCAICGKDLTIPDFTGVSDTARANIRMVHDRVGLTVSEQEAARLEDASTTRLRKAKKLSLIVDLDQTIIQATVDPTVGDWMRDGTNPNHSALKDVCVFKLGTQEDKEVVADVDGCWYYLKLRPGLQAFLRKMADLYEMHVYTMGTRSYAMAVCRIIDPDGTYFSTRILSRDESGSLTRKSLERLFPCDTSMAVIIDDRSDVWHWSPNLVKVEPFEFFVGVGDINGAFLPPTDTSDAAPLPTAIAPQNLQQAANGASEITAEEQDALERRDLEAKAQKTASALKEQVADRPLAKKQLALDADIAKGTSEHSDSAASSEASASPEIQNAAVLKDTDAELYRIEQLLLKVHTDFYAEQSSQDVKLIIPNIKESVLRGCKIAFSSMIPLGTNPEAADIWKLAKMFGAYCSSDVNSKTTHLVARNPGTVKVQQAQKRQDLHVVWSNWLVRSAALWQRQPEREYLMPRGSDALQKAAEIFVSSVSTDSEDEDEPSELLVDSLDRKAWDDADDEVDAFLNETDDDDDGSIDGSTRKRPRSSASSSSSVREATESPLVKRQRQAKERLGKSQLKSVTFGEQTTFAPEDRSSEMASKAQSLASTDDDDDFLDSLAADLEAEFVT